MNTNRVGLPAVRQFYSKYKAIHRNIELKKHERQAPVAYLEKLEKFNLLPSPLGIVSPKGDNSIVNIRSFLIGDKYADALGSGLKYSSASKVNICSNRLKPEGGLKIIKGLNTNIKDIDLSSNQLGQTGACMEYLISNVISDRRFTIETLILDSNKITDRQSITLSEALIFTSNRTIRILSLQQNNIGDLGVKAFSEMLEINAT